MSSPLRWDITGRDELSEILAKLARSSDTAGRALDRLTADAKAMGRATDGSARSADHLGDEMDQSGRQATTLAARLGLAGRASQAAQHAWSGLTGMLSTAAAAMRTAGLAIAAGAAAAAGGMAMLGVKAAAANEQASITFEILLGSQQRALAFMDKLKGFAAATPFDLPTLREAAAGLLTVGVEANRIIPLLTRIGDATAAMGTGAFGVDRAVFALKQMALAGRATKEDLNQLTDAGLPVFSALAAHLGATVQEMLDLVSEGKVSAEDVFRAIETGAGESMGRIAGMMARQSGTLAGMWSTFKDNAEQALADLFEPAMPSLKRLLDFLGRSVPAGIEKLKSMGKEVIDIFKGSDLGEHMMNGWKRFRDEVLPPLQRSWDSLVQTIGDNREGLESFGRFVAEGIVPALGMFIGKMIELTGMMANLYVVIMARIIPVMRWFTSVFLESFGLIIEGAKAAFGWVPGLGPQLNAAAIEFEIFKNRVMGIFDQLEGKGLNTFSRITAAARSVGTAIGGAVVTYFNTPVSRQYREYAEGGTVTGGAWGSPQIVKAHVGEEILNPTESIAYRAGRRGGDVETVYLQPVTMMLEGERVWQGLLRFKSRTGRRQLGLA